ncbi:hypothetical protein [Tenacibaculum aestuarii]|uniref:hypothetical protein n=1 Tax=Tenacibaculum aestuarii TaxID=362781 RepID=UPI00389642FD
MELLYEQLIQLLSNVPELKWIDLDVGQLQEDHPPVLYPCALIEISADKAEDIENHTQQVSGRFKITLAFKAYGETNSTTDLPTRSNALEYFRIATKCYKELQGFTNDNFYPFSRTSERPENIKKELKVVAQYYDTSWHDYTAS